MVQALTVACVTSHNTGHCRFCAGSMVQTFTVACVTEQQAGKTSEISNISIEATTRGRPTDN